MPQDDAADFLSTEDNDIESNGEEQTLQTVAPKPAKQRSIKRELARQKKDDDSALEHAIGRALAEKLANEESMRNGKGSRMPGHTDTAGSPISAAGQNC